MTNNLSENYKQLQMPVAWWLAATIDEKIDKANELLTYLSKQNDRDVIHDFGGVDMNTGQPNVQTVADTYNIVMNHRDRFIKYGC